MQLGDLIKYARLKKGVSQKELARRIGSKQSSISRFEGGHQEPSVSFLKRIAEAIGMRIVVSIEEKI